MQATREIGRRQQTSRGPKAAETGMHATSGDRQATTRADAARHAPSLRGRWRLSLGWSVASPIIGIPRNAEASMPRAPRTWPECFPDASSGSASEVESRQSAREKMSPRDRAENRPWRRRAVPATRPEDEDAINVTSGAARNPAGAWVRPSGMPAKVAMQRPRMPAEGTPEHLRVTVASREMLASTKAGSNMPTRPKAPFESTVTIPQSLRANSTERIPEAQTYQRGGGWECPRAPCSLPEQSKAEEGPPPRQARHQVIRRNRELLRTAARHKAPADRRASARCCRS